MNQIPNDLYKKIIKISNEVRMELRSKGLAIPVENSNGTISFGNYIMLKTQDGFYSIIDHSGETIIDQINLPQTAIILSNDLALGRFINDQILKLDKAYGYALFEELVYQKALSKSKKKSLEHFELMLNKQSIAKIKKDSHKKSIDKSFEKLRKLA